MATATAKREKVVEPTPNFKHASRLRQIREHFAKIFKTSTSLVHVHPLYNSDASHLSRYRVNHLETTDDAHFSTGYKIVQSYFVVVQDPSGSGEDGLKKMGKEPVRVATTSPKILAL